MTSGIKTFMMLLLLLPLTGAAQDTTLTEVTFSAGENQLQGKLILPEGVSKAPVLLFLGGIDEFGDVHRNREIFISENLIPLTHSGIALFYYDPRGVGDSEGRWHRATIQDFAEDAKAAVSFLKQRPEIKGDSIGVIGHGEDGWVAQILAAEIPDQIQMIASVAGPTFDATTHLINEYHNNYVCKGKDSLEALHKAEEKALSHENWVSIFPLTKRWRHMKMKQGFDPAVYLQQIEIPALFVFGEQDGIVYPDWAVRHLNEAFKDSIPPNIKVEIVPGANHYFKVNDRCYQYQEGDVMVNYSFRFKEVLQNWVFEHFD